MNKKEAEIIKWSTDFELDIRAVDISHQKIITHINKLYNICCKGQRDEVSEILRKLNQYVNQHFGYEERMFVKFNYEDTEAHRARHQIFKDKLAEVGKMFLSQDSKDVDKQLMVFLLVWFRDHILKDDIKYIDLFKKNL
ncbi:MAG: hemerythrin family protein [Bacteriovoracaceae bacterium]|nr:hemerythrin family protein [Bacteriovoracaceae bacterium]